MNDDATPPKWAQFLERKMSERLRQDKDPFAKETITSRLMYWSIVTLSYSMLLVIGIQFLGLFAKPINPWSVYMFCCLLLALGIWGWMNYFQRKRDKLVWDFLPKAYRDYTIRRGKLYRFNWHVISIAILTGGSLFMLRAIGIQDYITHLSPPNTMTKRTPKPLTPAQQEAQKTIERLAETLGTTIPLPKLPPPPQASAPASPPSDTPH